MTPSREPVMWANIVAAIMSVLSLLVALDVISLTDEQFAAIETAVGAFGVVFWPILAGLIARSQVTPLADPKDVDGAPLVRETGAQPIKVAERAAAENEWSH